MPITRYFSLLHSIPCPCSTHIPSGRSTYIICLCIRWPIASHHRSATVVGQHVPSHPLYFAFWFWYYLFVDLSKTCVAFRNIFLVFWNKLNNGILEIRHTWNVTQYIVASKLILVGNPGSWNIRSLDSKFLGPIF